MIKAEDYIPLVHSVTRKRHKQFCEHYEYDDLFQVACMGLLEAIKNYNSDKGSFVTFAYIHVDKKILKYINGDKWAMTKWENRIKDFSNAVPLSLDIKIKDEKGNESKSYIDLLEGEDFKEDNSLLKIALDKLPEILKEIISLRYFCGYTQTQTGKLIGLKQMKISRLEKQALDLLRLELV